MTTPEPEPRSVVWPGGCRVTVGKDKDHRPRPVWPGGLQPKPKEDK